MAGSQISTELWISVAVTKQLRKSKEESWILAHDFEVSVSGHLASWFWGCGKAEDHVREQEVEGNCSPHSSQEADGERKGQNPMEPSRTSFWATSSK